MTEPRHCDDIIHDHNAPICLRWFLLAERMPAVDQVVMMEAIGMPKLFAKHGGKPVRVVMASRLGDVGITSNLKNDHGYQQRVSVDDLTDFSANIKDVRP